MQARYVTEQVLWGEFGETCFGSSLFSNEKVDDNERREVTIASSELFACLIIGQMSAFAVARGTCLRHVFSYYLMELVLPHRACRLTNSFSLIFSLTCYLNMLPCSVERSTCMYVCMSDWVSKPRCSVRLRKLCNQEITTFQLIVIDCIDTTDRQAFSASLCHR